MIFFPAIARIAGIDVPERPDIYHHKIPVRKELLKSRFLYCLKLKNSTFFFVIHMSKTMFVLLNKICSMLTF